MRECPDRIRAICDSRSFRDEITALLFKLVEIDTSPTADISAIRENEAECFRLIKGYLKNSPLQNAEITEEPINPEVEKHKAFTRPYYAAAEGAPDGLPLEQVYEGRRNLLCVLNGAPGPPGRNTAVNAHIDVVAPFFPPRIEGGLLYGRGACDDKANVVIILGALRIIGMLSGENPAGLKNRITAMFVIDEETGGNGSLSIVLSENIRGSCDSILVMEACENNIHPANRGAVWFKLKLRKAEGTPPGISLPEAAAFAVLSMQDEGLKIKSESEHPLFPHRPVQTCNGILGPFGEHPSRICGKVSFAVKPGNGTIPPAVKAAVAEGVRKFTEKFGDKTLIKDSSPGVPKVPRHYDFEERESGAVIHIHGSTGHMGAILENDDAILKWAYVMKTLAGLKKQFPLEFEFPGFESSSELILEGGQGFIPTHAIEEVQERMKKAAARGVAEYLASRGEPGQSVIAETTFDKLHNDAFDGAPGSGTMLNALKSGKEAGIIPENYVVRGWDVSCDARLFAELKIPVVTSGVGSLREAHSNDEFVKIEELFPMIMFTALFLLRETGSVSS